MRVRQDLLRATQTRTIVQITLAITGIMVFWIASIAQTSTGHAQATSGFVVSGQPDRQSPRPLAGETLDGRVYISYLAPLDLPRRVEFWLDDESTSGSATWVEGFAPFDFGGGSVQLANGWDTRSVSDGRHTLTVRVTSATRTYVESTWFYVRASATSSATPTPTATPAQSANPVPNALLVSASSTREDSSSLDGATLDGRVFIWVDTGITSIRRVMFWLDSDTSSTPRWTEWYAPYDFMGGSAQYGTGWNAGSVADGQHQIVAVIEHAGGKEALRATFTVGDGFVASEPAEPASSIDLAVESFDLEKAAINVDLSNAIAITPGQQIQSIVRQYPAGTTFLLKAGLHRGQTVTPRTGDTFVGETGAVMRGSIPLGSWSLQSGYWVATVSGLTTSAHGECEPEYGSTCRRGQELYINGTRLAKSTTLAGVSGGTWYLDYATSRVFVKVDPRGSNAELANTEYAFRSSADDVTIAGLVIEMYANRAQAGAVDATGGDRWTVANNVIRHNHGYGVRIGHDMRLLSNIIEANGQLGVGGVGNRARIIGNEIASNHVAGFELGWDAGGVKLAYSSGVLFSGNHIHHNEGSGIWIDIDGSNLTVEDNLIEWNAAAGIQFEISYDSVVRNNIARYNGIAYGGWLWGGQILIQNSAGMVVTSNEITVSANGGNGISIINQNRGYGPRGQYVARNNTVTGNTITYLGRSGRTGVADDYTGYSCSSAANNRFDGNTYVVTDATYWHWEHCAVLRWEQFRSLGHESSGMLIVK